MHAKHEKNFDPHPHPTPTHFGCLATPPPRRGKLFFKKSPPHTCVKLIKLFRRTPPAGPSSIPPGTPQRPRPWAFVTTSPSPLPSSQPRSCRRHSRHRERVDGTPPLPLSDVSPLVIRNPLPLCSHARNWILYCTVPHLQRPRVRAVGSGAVRGAPTTAPHPDPLEAYHWS